VIDRAIRKQSQRVRQEGREHSRRIRDRRRTSGQVHYQATATGARDPTRKRPAIGVATCVQAYRLGKSRYLAIEH
jgi:dihydroxyacid dehydratase/phosphogluconate dehydratase